MQICIIKFLAIVNIHLQLNMISMYMMYYYIICMICVCPVFQTEHAKNHGKLGDNISSTFEIFCMFHGLRHVTV